MDYFDGVAEERGVYEVYSERKYATILDVLGMTGLPQRRVLELGSGSGAFTKRLIQRGFEVVGLDISRRLLLEGQRALKNDRVRFVQASVTQLSLRNQAFDVVFGADILHHVPDQLDATFAEARRVLKPDGLLAFYEPNARHLRTKLLYKLGFAATPTEMALDPATLERKLRRSGFAIERLRPITIAEDPVPGAKELGTQVHGFIATLRTSNVLYLVWKAIRFVAFIGVTRLYEATGFASLFRRLDSMTRGEYVVIVARAASAGPSTGTARSSGHPKFLATPSSD